MSRQWTPADLDDALHALAGSLDVATPDYVTRVSGQLAARPRATRAPIGRRVLLLAAAFLLALGLVSVPRTRHAIASWFSFGGIDISYAPATSALPTPTGPAPLDAGTAVTMQTARAETDGRLVLVRGLPTPKHAFLMHSGSAVAITLAYRQALGLPPTPDTGYALVVTEIFDAGHPVFQKILHGGATSTLVSVHGRRGVFINGPQEIINSDRSGLLHGVEARTSANTLIWSDGDTTYRLEADVSQAAALDVAELLDSD